MGDEETYRKLFIAESRENHENIVRNLLILEGGADEEAIDEIFRSAHTLKGMSASMGYMEMEHLCHSMEDVFHLIRGNTLQVTPPLIDLLLACTDLVEEMLDDIETGGDSSTLSAGDMVAELEKMQETSPDIPCDETSVPAECPCRHEMTITVEDSCLMKDVRAMIVVQSLQEIGTISRVTPSLEEIEDGTFPGTLTLEIETTSTHDMLRNKVGTVDIFGVEICTISDDETPGGGEEDEPPEQKDKPQKGTDSGKAIKSRQVQNIRVEIQRLDHMMNLVEDLVINGGRLRQIARKCQIKELDESLAMVSRSVSDLQTLMMDIRMIPLNQIFNRFPRVVRDVANHDGKEVDFVIEGGETELDRSVMDGLSDPLLHLIRNSVNHGIETPKERIRLEKSPKGLIRLSARREQGNVIIDIMDDGGGIDQEKVLAKALEKGLTTPEEAAALKDEDVVLFLFAPGFSTAEAVTDISGRGVGLDVVKKAIESLNGSITVDTTPGKGTKFTLILPPTMAIVEVMMVRINGRRCAIPINTVVEVAQGDREEVHSIGGSEAILLRDEVLQIYQLNELFGGMSRSNIMVVVQYQGRKCCIPVDVVEGQQEVVVKPISNIIGNVRGVGGITIPGDGDVVPILDVNTMV